MAHCRDSGQLLVLVKALLLEKKILFYSSDASRASTAVLSFISLLPGTVYYLPKSHSFSTHTTVHVLRIARGSNPKVGDGMLPSLDCLGKAVAEG